MLILEMIVIQGITFVGLVLLLKKVLYSHFAKAMKRLQILSQETEKKRAELAARLEETEKSFEAKMKEQEEKMTKLRLDADREAEEIRAHALAEGQREADKLLEQTRAKEEELRRELEAQVGEKATHLAGDALRYVLGSRFDETIHHQLVKDLVREIEDLEAKRLNGQSSEVRVLVPFTLQEDEKSKLLEAIEKKIKKKISVSAEIDRSLIAGMVLQFDNVILDGSLKTRLKDAVSYVRKAEKKS